MQEHEWTIIPEDDANVIKEMITSHTWSMSCITSEENSDLHASGMTRDPEDQWGPDVQELWRRTRPPRSMTVATTILWTWKWALHAPGSDIRNTLRGEEQREAVSTALWSTKVTRRRTAHGHQRNPRSTRKTTHGHQRGFGDQWPEEDDSSQRNAGMKKEKKDAWTRSEHLRRSMNPKRWCTSKEFEDAWEKDPEEECLGKPQATTTTTKINAINLVMASQAATLESHIVQNQLHKGN